MQNVLQADNVSCIYIMAWQIQASVRAKPFGKVVGRWYEFEVQPTAADLIIKTLGRPAEDKFDVYDAALLLAPSTLLSSEMSLMVCPK